MPHAGRVRAALGLLLSAAAALPAQERKALVGRVLDATGAPLPGATVTLAWSPPGGEDCGPTDVVKAVTDERGRFVAKVLAQESYSAWAVLPLPDGTRAKATAVADQVAAGADLELRCDREVVPHILNLEGASAYAGIGPLRLQVAPRAGNLALFDVTVSGEAAFLPSVGLIVVRDQQGGVLFARGTPDATPGTFVFRLPPATTLNVRVLGPDRKPLAGASIRHCAGNLSTMLAPETPFAPPQVYAWRICGTTGADGGAQVLVPWPAVPSATPLLVSAPGMAEHCIAVADQATSGQPIEVILQPAARVRVHRSGAPLAGAEAMLTASYVGPTFERATMLRLGDDGTCEVPLPVAAIETMLHVRGSAREPWHLRRIPLMNGALGSYDLADERTLSLQFLDCSGGPARGMPGILMAIGSRHADGQQVPVCTDQAGRLERTLGPDAWVLFLCDGTQWARYDIPRRDAPGAPLEFRDAVRCEPLPVARLHVLDSSGKPVAGAGIVHAERIGAAARPGAAPDPAGNLLDVTMQRLIDHLVRESRSDVAGLLAVRTLPSSRYNIYTLAVFVSAAGFGQVRLPIEPDAEKEAVLPAAPPAQPAKGR
jgi:hypothetical protein